MEPTADHSLMYLESNIDHCSNYYDCITTPTLNGAVQTFHMLTDSVGREFGCGTLGINSLYPTMSEASAGEHEAQRMESCKGSLAV